MKLKHLSIIAARCSLHLALSCALGCTIVECMTLTQGYILATYSKARNALTVERIIEVPTVEASTVTVEDLRRLARAHAARQGIDHRIIEALIEVESRWNADAISPAGALGIMQLMPMWKGNELCPSIKSNADFFNPNLNIECGVNVLAYELAQQRTLKRALQRYNGSENCLRSPECAARTERYAQKIITATLDRLVKQG